MYSVQRAPHLALAIKKKKKNLSGRNLQHVAFSQLNIVLVLEPERRAAVVVEARQRKSSQDPG